jgi:hypothetical protein
MKAHAMTSAQPEPDLAEYLAAEHMRSLGFRGAKRTATGPDGGVDVEAPTAIAQVKHLKGSVGRPAIQQLLGTGGRSISRLFYSAGGFSRPALELADSEGVALFTYDLGTRKITPVGETASRLERAADYPGAEHAEPAPAPVPPPPVHAVPPFDRRPPGATRAAATRAVQEQPDPSELRWYFYTTCFSGGVLGWMAFLHAYKETQNRYWLNWTIGAGAWALIAVVTASALSGGRDAEGNASPGQAILGFLMAAAIGVMCVWLTAARRQALGFDAPVPLAGLFDQHKPRTVAYTAPQTDPNRTGPVPSPPVSGYFDPTPTTRSAPPVAPRAEPAVWWERPGPGRHIGSYIWAASPFLMVSFGTSITFLVAACLRPRRWELWVYFAFYLGLFVGSMITSSTGPGWLFGLIIAFEWLIATGHAFLIRRRVWYLPRRDGVAQPHYSAGVGSPIGVPQR